MCCLRVLHPSEGGRGIAAAKDLLSSPVAPVGELEEGRGKGEVQADKISTI